MRMRIAKNGFYKAFVVLLLLSGPGIMPSFSQADSVKRSENKILLDGKVYYIHVVKEGESLEQIGKAYNISRKALVIENPDLFGGLRPGMVLKIPSEPAPMQEVEIKETEKYKYHVVEKGETLYSISRKYDMKVDDLVKHNPEVKYSDLQINQVLKIPKIPEPENTGVFPEEDFIYHYVENGESIYSISRRYDVRIEDIKRMNPELRWGEMKIHEYIRIPRTSVDTGGKVLAPDTIVSQQVMSEILEMDTTYFDSLDMKLFEEEEVPLPSFCDTAAFNLKNKKPVKVALLMPLYLDRELRLDSLQQDTLTAEEIEKMKEEELPWINPRAYGFLEFYEGSLLALDSLQREGISVDLFVFDTQGNASRVKQLLQEDKLDDMDMVFGPAFPSCLRLVAEYGLEHSIPLISPFSTDNKMLYTNPFFIQICPSYLTEVKEVTDFISGYGHNTLIMISDGDSLNFHKRELFKNELFRKLENKADLQEVVFKEVVYNDSNQADLNHVLAEEDQNMVMIMSDDEAYVSNLLTHLQFLLKDYRITVFGKPSWSKFRSIDHAYLHNMESSIYTPFYVDYDASRVTSFLEKYWMHYDSEPFIVSSKGYIYGFLGYDLFYFFIRARTGYGPGFRMCIPGISPELLLGDYRFKRVNRQGGYVRKDIYFVRYDRNFNVTRIPDIRKTEEAKR